MRYIKKPIAVEAWQFDVNKSVPEWLINNENAFFEPKHIDGSRVVLFTLEGIIVARLGDWIVKGLHDELYPVKDDIFRESYDPA